MDEAQTPLARWWVTRVLVAAADIVSCATLSTAALIEGRWLAPGTHLDLIGSFTPQMREADAACFERSRVFVDTSELFAQCLVRLAARYADLCAGRSKGRGQRDEITLFKAVGSALEDLAAAELVFDRLPPQPGEA